MPEPETLTYAQDIAQMSDQELVRLAGTPRLGTHDAIRELQRRLTAARTNITAHKLAIDALADAYQANTDRLRALQRGEPGPA